ncbi:MAG: S8 family serine peptidase [Phycisphaerales bacterium]|nr:S8 family serine peptidase [Phycisphaerales bacterium]
MLLGSLKTRRAMTAMLGVAAVAISVSINAAEADTAGVREVRVPGTSVVLRLWDAADRTGQISPHYAISLDGRSFSKARPTSYQIKLRHGGFEPLTGERPAIEPGFAGGADTNLYIVQFLTQPIPEFREAIEDLGGDVYFFLPRHSHIVRMNPEARDAVEALPFVRWIGEYHPAYRLEEYMLHNADDAAALFPLQRYNIMIMRSDMGMKKDVARKIESLGGTVDHVHAGKYLVQATLTPAQLFEVTRFDEVLFIDRWGPYETDMNNSRLVSGADYVETLAGFTGQGVRGEVFDAGFNLSHVDFASRPLIVHGSAGSDSHGASTSGICFGDGTGNANARGILPDGQGIVSDYDGILGEHPARYDHTGELLEAPYYGVFQTSSVGSPRTFYYTTVSADNDAALFDFDILHCQSQSNAGNQDSRPEAWSKNIISGGGVHHYDTADKSDDCWCYGGSTGPASDGRIKPDLCHFYDDTLTVTTGSSTAYTYDFGGTSGATPNIAGYTGLFFQMWSEGIFGNEVDPFGTVFENRCHMTTAKAAMINTASQYPFSGTGHDLTRVHQGWGMPDVARLYDMRDKMLIIDETDVLCNLESVVYVVSVAPDEAEFKATLVFADPAGNPAASEHRINDLTLKVTAPDATVYWGNNGLLANMYSTSGGDPNSIDTVENVFVQNPLPGAWFVEVFADEIVQDSHVETPELDADFALVVSGVTPVFDAGVVRLDRTYYACDADAMIMLTDAGLNLDDDAVETTSVVIDSDSEPLGEWVLLTETAADSATFTGSIALSIVDAGGTLLITEGDTVTVSYIDADDGQGGIDVLVTDTAVVDCTAPIISGVTIHDIGPYDAWVTFQTDEQTRGSVRYGTSCGMLTETASQAGFGTEHLVHVVGLNEDSSYFLVVDAEDAASNSSTDDNSGQCYAFDTTDIPLYFTEEFGGFDLDGYTITFEPDGSVDHYVACIEEATSLPTDPAGGNSLTLSDDDYETVTPGANVVLYGVSYNRFYVGSNGYITFTSGDTDYTESREDHFAQPRISGLFDDLNPSVGGTVSWKNAGDHVAVTWQGVPEYSTSNSNTFQIELFMDGTIQMTWLGIDSTDSIVGLSAGGGVPVAFYWMDLSNVGSCTQPCPGDLNGDGQRNQPDLGLLLSSFGIDAGGDIDGDGDTDQADLGLLLSVYDVPCP